MIHYKYVFNLAFYMLSIYVCNVQIDITQKDSSTILLNYTKEFGCSETSSLKIKSVYFNVPDSVSRDGLFLKSQDIVVKFGEKKVNVTPPPLKHHIVNLGSKAVKVLSTNIVGIKCIKHTSTDFVYSVYGADNNDTPHEFFGVLSKDGHWLWYYYGTTRQIYAHFGNYSRLTSHYGKKELENLKNMEQVLPSY